MADHVVEISEIGRDKLILNIAGIDGKSFKLDATFIPSSFETEWIDVAGKMVGKSNKERTAVYFKMLEDFFGVEGFTVEWMSKNLRSSTVARIATEMFRWNAEGADSKNSVKGRRGQ